MTKRGRVDEADDHEDGDGECDEEDTKKLVKLVNTFFTASLAEKEPDAVGKPRRPKEHKMLPVVQEEPRHPEDDFDEELSFLFGSAVALMERHDFRKQDALYATKLPYIS